MPLARRAVVAFPLRDHLHQAVVGGDVLAGVPALRSSRAIRGTSQPLDSRSRRNVWLLTSVTARVFAYQGTTGPLALRFAPIRSPGFRMPRGECAVELAGAGDAQGDREVGGCAPRRSRL